MSVKRNAAPKRRTVKKHTEKRTKQRTASRQVRPLRFTPYAWAKLLTLRDAGETEVGGFGIAAGSDLTLVEDLALVTQRCDWASVEFADEAVADFFDRQVDRGLRPEQFGRIWIHTHPGHSPQPSGTDEETFARVFGSCDWAIMFILAQGGASYARLQFGVGPGASVELPVKVDYSAPFPAADPDGWLEEYRACVQEISEVETHDQLAEDLTPCEPDQWSAYDDYRWTTLQDERGLQDEMEEFYAN